MSERSGGSAYGVHRVISPAGVLPQAAQKIDNSLPIYDNEILIDVSTLNIDSASFRQMKELAGGSPDGVAEIIFATVASRGKQHNPVTGSGGMLIGRVEQVGSRCRGEFKVRPGDRIATLVSLSLTPLMLGAIKAIRMDREQVDVEAKAILFESGIAAVLPGDIPERVALAALDVAGAPAQTGRLVKPGMKVLVIGGGGKSGTMCLYVAKRKAGPEGLVIGLGSGMKSVERMRSLGYADLAIEADAKNPVDVFNKVSAATGGAMADVVINCANAPGTEMASIMSARGDGIVYFFSMATSFTAAALGAEGIGHGATMIIGNGYCPGHAEYALDLLRSDPVLMKHFTEAYA